MTPTPIFYEPRVDIRANGTTFSKEDTIKIRVIVDSWHWWIYEIDLYVNWSRVDRDAAIEGTIQFNGPFPANTLATAIGAFKFKPEEDVHYLVWLKSIDFSIYSPPFSDLYNYSSSERDLSNCRDYKTFLKHYDFVIENIARLTKPGRLSCVHCTDISNSDGSFTDFQGDIINLHKQNGFLFVGRRIVWKEPLRMAIRTRSKGLMHRQIVKDASKCNVASGDYILAFKKTGKNCITEGFYFFAEHLNILC